VLETPDPGDKPLVEFFRHAHSVQAALEGWRLALWCEREPAALDALIERGGRPVMFGWPSGPRRPFVRVAGISVDQLLAHPALIEPGQRVVLARRELPPEVFALLREQLGYEPDVVGQVLGWWYELDEAIPTQRPRWRPTGGLLPEGGRLEDGVECLVLVEVNDCRYVLSERALSTYTFGATLAEGEELRFVWYPDGQRQVWTVRAREPISPREAARRFPAVAEEAGANLTPRARADARSVVVRVARDAAAE